jgi:RimJ/RimL family protein N-acetyltransferase
MERAGFKLEGISRESLMLKGRLADMANYALIREDYIKAGKKQER